MGSLWIVVDRCGSFRVLVTTQVKLSYSHNYYMSSGFALVLYTLHQIFGLSCGILDSKVSLHVVQKV